MHFDALLASYGKGGFFMSSPTLPTSCGAGRFFIFPCRPHQLWTRLTHDQFRPPQGSYLNTASSASWLYGCPRGTIYSRVNVPLGRNTA